MRNRRAGVRGRAVLAVVVLALSIGAAGCAQGPAARAWAASVCQAMAPWRTAITELNGRAQQQMTAETTPAQAKENLVRLLSGAQDASEQARRRVADAGVPAVDNGDAIAHSFVASLTAVRDAYARARAAIEDLDTGQPEVFYAGVSDVLGTLNEEYARSALDTSTLDSRELRVAFDEVPECR